MPYRHCRLMPHPCGYLIRKYTADQSIAPRRSNLSKRFFSSSHAIWGRTGSKWKPPLGGDERDDKFSARGGSLGAPRRGNCPVGRPALLSWGTVLQCKKRLDQLQSQFLAIIEPALMLLGGFIVGGIILAMYLPVFSVRDVFLS